MSNPTLEQQRAMDAWKKSEGCSKEYVNLAKALPALIMNSGLMQTMAFLHEKGNKGKANAQHKEIGNHLRNWLHTRFPEVPEPFDGFMTSMMAADPRHFQAVNAEAFAWLRWMRQIAAARQGGG